MINELEQEIARLEAVMNALEDMDCPALAEQVGGALEVLEDVLDYLYDGEVE